MPPSAETARENVARCIDDAVAVTDRLRATLEDEYRALEERDQALLDDAVSRKLDCLHALQAARPRERLEAMLAPFAAPPVEAAAASAAPTDAPGAHPSPAGASSAPLAARDAGMPVVASAGDTGRRGAGAGARTAAALAQLDGSGTLGERWQRLLGLTAHCRSMNERNGLVANRLRGRTEQALVLLQAAVGLETAPVVYGPDGTVASPVTRLPRPR